MGTPRIIYGGYERTASGMVYVGKSSEQTKMDRINRVKCFLLSLVEEEFELSFRSQNCLNSSGIKLVGQLVQTSASKLLCLKNFGRSSLHDIEQNLVKKGFTLDMRLHHFPWNGAEGSDEFIRILSLQKPGGGFSIDQKTAVDLGIDQTKINALFSRNQPSVSGTKCLLEILESKFMKTEPYLADLLNPHRRWLESQQK